MLVSIDSEFTRYHFFYDANGSPIGYATSETMFDGSWDYFWYEKNMHGDIIAVYGNDGTKLISYTYDAWGNFTITEHATVLDNVLKNPFTYRGYFYYHELGMYYLGTRWYDPAIGRFISPDRYASTGQGILGYNMYAYCNNNPVNFVDPSGEAPWLIIVFIAGMGIAGAIIGASLDTRMIDNVKNVNTASAKPIEIKNSLDEDLNVPQNGTNDSCDVCGAPLNDELTAKDRVANGLIGAAGGVAIGGTLVIAAALAAGLSIGATSAVWWFGGASAVQALAVGSLSYNVLPILIAPIIGLEMDVLEFG